VFIHEVIELPNMVTSDATPVQMGARQFVWDATVRVIATVMAFGGPQESATWRLDSSYEFTVTNGIPYLIGSAISSKVSLGDGSLWDATIVAVFGVPDVAAYFTFELTGQAATNIVWSGTADVYRMMHTVP
jgi:hypothetical protein